LGSINLWSGKVDLRKDETNSLEACKVWHLRILTKKTDEKRIDEHDKKQLSSRKEEAMRNAKLQKM
jgi:hypothetical protein